MEVLSFSAPVSGESSCDDSTGPTTPNSSPLFCPSIAEGIIEPRFSFLNASKEDIFQPIQIQPDRTIEASSCASCHYQDAKSICFIGAGYVGKLITFYKASKPEFQSLPPWICKQVDVQQLTKNIDIGGPTAAVIALHNPLLKIVVLDKDENRIRRWNSRHLPIKEPGLESIIRITREGASSAKDREDSQTLYNDIVSETEAPERLPNLFFTSNSQRSISEADIIFLAVSTPTKTFGVGAGRATDMTATYGAVKDVAKYARAGAIIVEKSTVPCGTAKRIRQMLQELRPGTPFEVLSNPEFLSEGSAIENLMKPDRIIIGSLNTISGRRSANALAKVYSSWIPTSRILQTNVSSSELSKLLVNAMLAQRISSINSVSAICDATGANIDEVARSVGLDPRVGPQFLKSGLGFGGSCFRKDIASLTYLAKSLGLDEVADYWDQVNLVNEMQRLRFAKNVIRRLDDNLVRKKIVLLGFAFKKNTGDTRESLAVDTARILLEERPEEVAIFDPFCREEDIQRELKSLHQSFPSLAGPQNLPVKVYADPYQACSNASAILIITDHDVFRSQAPGFLSRSSNERDQSQPKSISTIPKSKYQGQNGSPEPHSSPADEVFVSTTGRSYKLLPTPACSSTTDCSFCNDPKSHTTLHDPLQWSRIAQLMDDPKWLFDGRGILDTNHMTQLGFQVDTIGRGRHGGPTMERHI